MAWPEITFMKAKINRRALWLWPVAISCMALPARAQNTPNEMAARTREWRLDGTIVGLDSKRGLLRLQPDVLVMRAEGGAVEMGAARETATRLIATDDATQMWTPDGQLRPLEFAALRNAAQIIAIGPLQNEGDQTILRARLVLLREGLPNTYSPQVLAAPVATVRTPPQISAPAAQEQLLAAPQSAPMVAAPATPRTTLAMREAPIPLPVAPPIVNRAPQNEDARHAMNVNSFDETSRTQTPVESSSHVALSRDDWSRRVPPPTLSIAPNETNTPQGLAVSISPTRDVVMENRAVSPPHIERAAPQEPPLLSENINIEDLTAPVTNFPRAAMIENAPSMLAPELRATAPLGAPRDTRRPALSLDATTTTGRGALTSAIAPQIDKPGTADGRTVLRLDDAQSQLLQQQTATLARDNYAQLRSVQNAIPWTTFSNGLDDEKIVALTFDDGPHPTGTPAILAQLRRFHVPATFFVVGRNVEKHPDLLRQEAAQGHDIANHSWHHFQGVKLSAEQWHEEIAGNNRIIENVIGIAPRWFRAPGCHYSLEALNALHDLKMVRADTSNNSGDWEQPDPQKIVNRVLQRLAPGQVLLFHDSAPQTAKALPILLNELRARGYRCVTMSELAGRAVQVPSFVPEFHPSGQGIVLPQNVVATR